VTLLFSAITNGALLPSTSLTLQEIHLVRCLTDISHRHFAPDRTLVISSPATYRDVRQELIAEIQRTAIWPVVVSVDGNISKNVKTDFIDKDGGYIILIPDGNIKSFLVEILGLILDKKNQFKKLFNSEARFVVAGANEFTLSQQTHIFDYLSKFRIYNCIIVSQEQDVIDKKYSRTTIVNDVDTSMKLGVYTWFPYQSSDRCTEVNDITLLDSWVIFEKGHFTKNSDLFTGKLGNNLNRCPIKALVSDSNWDFGTKYVNHVYSNGTVVSYIVGLDIEFLRVVLHKMNMTYVLVPIPEDFETEKNLAMHIIDSLFVKDYYIIVSNVGNYLLSNPFLSSTNSYYIMTISWYVPCSVKYPRWSSIFRILSVELWLVLIILTLTAVISTTLVARYSCTSEWQGYKTLTSSLTNILAVSLGVSVSTMPRTPSLRLLFLAWVCFSLAFSTVFQAFLTTFLIDSGYKTPIQNMDELFSSGIRLAYPEGSNFLFEENVGPESLHVQRNRANCPSYDECLNWAIYHKNVSVLLHDEFAEEYFATGYFVGENSEPLLCTLDDGVFFSYGKSMVMFNGDPLIRRFNEIIDRVVEAGLHTFWNSLRLNFYKIYSRKIAIFHPLDECYSFNLYHMQPAFYLLLIGWCLSAFCYMFEVLYNRLLSKRN
jgi:hypothetical protein